MKLREDLTDEDLDNIAGVIDNEGLGYIILYGGLEPATPENVLDDLEDIKRVNEALRVISEFASILPEY